MGKRSRKLKVRSKVVGRNRSRGQEKKERKREREKERLDPETKRGEEIWKRTSFPPRPFSKIVFFLSIYCFCPLCILCKERGIKRVKQRKKEGRFFLFFRPFSKWTGYFSFSCLFPSLLLFFFLFYFIFYCFFLLLLMFFSV